MATPFFLQFFSAPTKTFFSRHATATAALLTPVVRVVWRRAQGYRCLVPDLYKGKLGVNVEEAHHLMTNLDWPGAKGDSDPEFPNLARQSD